MTEPFTIRSIISCVVYFIPLQFENRRFEMVIVMPDRFKGLLYFADSAKRGLNIPEAENIFRVALDALGKRSLILFSVALILYFLIQG